MRQVSGVFVLLIGLFAASLILPEQGWGLRVKGHGDPIGDMRLYSAQFEPIALSGRVGEHGALVVFWASWNPRSQELLEHLSSLYAKYSEHGLEVLPINVENEDLSRQQVDSLAQHYQEWLLPWRTWFDVGFEAFSEFGVITYPTSVYISKDLVIVGAYPGFPQEARDALPELIEKGLGIWAPAVVVRKPVEVRYQPKNKADYRFHMARLLYHRGQRSKATRQLERAVAADPDYAIALAALAFTTHQSGRSLERVEKVLQLLQERSGAEPRFREALGVCLLALGRRDEAREVLGPLLDEEEPRPRGLVALALIHHEAGELEEAKAILERLQAWNMGEVLLAVDVSAYLDTDLPPGQQFVDPTLITLRILDFASPFR